MSKFSGHTAVLTEAWATLPESSSRPLAATLALSRNLAHATLETAVVNAVQVKVFILCEGISCIQIPDMGRVHLRGDEALSDLLSLSLPLLHLLPSDIGILVSP